MNKFCLTNKIIVFSLLLSTTAFCQSSYNEKPFFQWFDNLINAKNSNLINGVFHSEKYETKEGHDQYYLTRDFLIGDLVYDNQAYFNVNLLYDLYSDDLILGFYENDLLLTIQLIKDKVDSFSMNNKSFTRLMDQESGISGFYEVLVKTGELTLYNKHLKRRFRYIDDQQVYYKFKKKTNYLVHYQNDYKEIHTKKDVSKLFPEKKTFINDFFSSNNYLLNSDKDKFMVLLFQQIVAK